MSASKGCVITLTKFGKDADEVAVPLVLANTAQVSGEEVLLWLTMEGVKLVKPGEAETLKPISFSPVTELMKEFVGNGGRIGVCPPCAKTHGVTKENMIANSEFMGAAALLSQSKGCRSFFF